MVPRRGEVWLVNLDPTVGDEIRKRRPAVVVSSDSIARLRLGPVAPITGWSDRFAEAAWQVRLVPDDQNGLTKVSSADVLQLRGISYERFVERLGRLNATTMEEIAAAIAIVVEYH